jgi:hypothetical protein
MEHGWPKVYQTWVYRRFEQILPSRNVIDSMDEIKTQMKWCLRYMCWDPEHQSISFYSNDKPNTTPKWSCDIYQIHGVQRLSTEEQKSVLNSAKTRSAKQAEGKVRDWIHRNQRDFFDHVFLAIECRSLSGFITVYIIECLQPVQIRLNLNWHLVLQRILNGRWFDTMNRCIQNVSTDDQGQLQPQNDVAPGRNSEHPTNSSLMSMSSLNESNNKRHRPTWLKSVMSFFSRGRTEQSNVPSMSYGSRDSNFTTDGHTTTRIQSTPNIQLSSPIVRHSIHVAPNTKKYQVAVETTVASIPNDHALSNDTLLEHLRDITHRYPHITSKETSSDRVPTNGMHALEEWVTETDTFLSVRHVLHQLDHLMHSVHGHCHRSASFHSTLETESGSSKSRIWHEEAVERVHQLIPLTNEFLDVVDRAIAGCNIPHEKVSYVNQLVCVAREQVETAMKTLRRCLRKYQHEEMGEALESLQQAMNAMRSVVRFAFALSSQ